MSALLRAWAAERSLALRRPEVRIGALALLVLAGLYALGVATLLESDLPPDAVRLLTGSQVTGFAVAFQSSRVLLRVLGLLALLWGAASVAGELEQGTHRPVLLRLTRRPWMMGKALHLAVLLAALSLGVVLVSLAVGALRLGLHAEQVGAVEVWSRGALLGTGLTAWALSLPSLWALAALALGLSCASRSAQGATTLTLFAAVLLWGLDLLPTTQTWGFVGSLDWPWQVAVNHAEGMRTLAFSDRAASHILVALGWTVALLGLGSWILRRRDLT